MSHVKKQNSPKDKKEKGNKKKEERSANKKKNNKINLFFAADRFAICK